MVLACFSMAAFAGNLVEVSVNPAKSEAAISQTFIGVSYETETMLSNEKVVRYFSPDNKALIAQFLVLGIKSLRIGGNTVDDNKIAIPSEDDIDALFTFAKAAGVKVIYSLRLKNGSPKAAATIAKYILDHYAESLDCFAIGNEPADFIKDPSFANYNYDTYRADWKRIMEAVVAAAPAARFCGPDTNPNPKWSKDFVADFADTGHLALLTGHLYAGGCSYQNPGHGVAYKDLIPINQAAARGRMLSLQWDEIYEDDRMGLTEATAPKRLPFRLTECNSFWYGGLKGTSDSYASALWGLDYLHWWAANGAAGINFHTGDVVHGPIPCQYAVFVTSEKGYHARPLGYGLKTFDLGGHGVVMPVTINKSNKLNLSAYASKDGDKTLNVTLINKEFGADAAEVEIHVASPFALASAKMVLLSAPNGDISATSGVTLGGAPIDDDGTWKGTWTPLPTAADGKGFNIKVSPASAAVIRAQLR